MRPAVSSMRFSGRNPMLTPHHEIAASASQRGERREQLDEEQVVQRVVDIGQRETDADPVAELVGERVATRVRIAGGEVALRVVGKVDVELRRRKTALERRRGV